MDDIVNEAALQMGYSSIRDKAILGFLSGRDVFVSLPTESAKSLCSTKSVRSSEKDVREHRHRCEPVSFKDKVHCLEAKGIKSVFVTKDTAKDLECDGSSLEQPLYEGSFQVVFFSPEALLCNDTWGELLQTVVYQKNVVAFVIDEAHLVKKW